MSERGPSIDPKTEAELLGGLAKLRGRGTLADIVRATGLPRERTEQDLKAMLGLYRSHLEVDEDGELLYLFDPSLARREEDGGAWLRSLTRWCWDAFKVVFKVSVMGILVTYVVAFSVLIVAALVALASAGGDGVDLDFGDGVGEGCFGFLAELLFFWDVGDVLFVPYVMATDARIGRRQGQWQHQGLHSAFQEPHGLEPRYATDTFETKRSRSHHFYEDVFAFVFGPTVPDPPGLAAERELLAWIHDHRGVITLTELITRTGLSVQEAQQEMTRLLVRFGGDVEVTEGGQLLYTFHDLKITAQKEGKLSFTPQAAPPAWHRFEPDPQLTGVSAGRNAAILSMVGFTFLMSILSPFLLAGLVGPLALPLSFFFTVIPLCVALGFFLIPSGRYLFDLLPRRAARQERNVRRALLLVIFEHISRSRQEALTRHEIIARARGVMRSLQDAKVGDFPEDRRKMEGLTELPNEVWSRELSEIFVEMDAALEDDGGRVRVSFPEQYAELEAADQARGLSGPKEVGLGQIIYSTADEDDDPLRDEIGALWEEEAGHTLPTDAPLARPEVQVEEAEEPAEVGAGVKKR